MNQQQNQQQQQPITFPPNSQAMSNNKQPPQQFGALPQSGASNQFGVIPQFTGPQGQQIKPTFQIGVPPSIKTQQNPPQIPGQPFPQTNPIQQQPINPGKPNPFQQNPVPNFAQKPLGPQGPTLQIAKGDNNNNNINKNMFPIGQNVNPPFLGIQPNNQFVPNNKFQQQIPAQPNTIPQQKYEPMDVKNEEDKKSLVQRFATYIKEGNLQFSIECMKQIISNDIRVKCGDGSKNSD